jgi:hypothetical protein
MATWRSVRPLRILDWDCENRPLSYLGGDFTTPELTVIAWKFPGRDMQVVYQPDHPITEMLSAFLEAYDEADMVTGHNIIKHDLRLINAMLLEQGEPPLHPKLVCDTYAHLKTRSPGFASQATLAEMMGVPAPKVSMSTVAWRGANRLLPEAVERAVKRGIGDVKQHIALRRELLRRGWLRPPRVWTP